MTPKQWQGSGHDFEVVEQVDRIPEFDPRSGEHIWTIMTAYRWGGPDVERPTLDLENLLLIVGPACHFCEQAYSRGLATRRCKGHP